MFFHVPMSFIATIAFFVAAWWALQYLRKKNMGCDIRSSAAASIGLLTTILATVTGSIWAKFNWGSFWNWDPRETSILILMLIYGAYFALRSAIDDRELRARLSAAYALIAVVAVPFLVFVLPRITNSLHPGGAGTPAPVVNADGSQNIDARMRIVLYSAFVLFLFLFAWIYRLRVKIGTIEIQKPVLSSSKDPKSKI